MKITDLKTFIVFAQSRNLVLLKLYTDEGLTGLGEATVHFREKAVAETLAEYLPVLIGQDPTRVEHIWNNLYRDNFHRNTVVPMAAISAIEQACWDITGKYYNTPVYRLFGGPVRDRVRLYANAWYGSANTPDEFGRAAADIVALDGYSALKFDPFDDAHLTMTARDTSRAIERVAAVREAVGTEVDILLDAHGRFNVSTAISVAKRLEPYRIFSYEEPCPPENVDVLAYVRRQINLPVAAGERWYTRHDFREPLEKQAVDIIQPDMTWSGGIMELKKIAAMAEVYYVSVAPHNASGRVALAANLQLAGCTTNHIIQEHWSIDVPWRDDVFDPPLEIKEGYIHLSDRPGLGIELNEAEAVKHPYQRLDFSLYSTGWHQQFEISD